MNPDFEKKLKRLNKLALEIDAWCHAMHPSGWGHANGKRLADYKRLAKKLFPAPAAAATPAAEGCPAQGRPAAAATADPLRRTTQNSLTP